MAAEGNYITDSDIDNWASGASDAVKLKIIQRAETLIEQVTKDYFYAKSFTAVLDGNAKSRLSLGLVPDILSVTEILLSRVSLSTSLFAFDKNSVFRAALTTSQCKAIEGITLAGTDPVSLNITAHGFITSESVKLISVVGITPSLDGEYVVTKTDADNFTLNGTDSSEYSGSFTSGTACFATLAELHYLTRRALGGLFPKGLMNISVTGTHGWVTTPPMIELAAVMLCRYENDSTLYTGYSGKLKSERLGDYAYTLADSDKVDDFTGVAEVDRLVKYYVRKKPMMGIA